MRHVEVIRPERNPIVLCVAGEEVLRQVRAVDGWVGIGADQRHRAVVRLAPEHLGRGHSRRPTADNHDRRWRLGGGGARGCRPRRRQLLPDEYPVAVPLHAPAGDWIQRRRAERLAGAEAEARVMPRTPHGVADDEPLHERPAVVRTVRPDGEQLGARPCQHDVLVADAPEDHAPVSQIPTRRLLSTSRESRASSCRSLAAPVLTQLVQSCSLVQLYRVAERPRRGTATLLVVTIIVS